MEGFIMHYGACAALCAMGLFFIAMTYGAYFTERSGAPFIGGLLIAVSFMTTPVKWLALLGLIDPGYWEIPYIIIVGRIRRKRFAAVYAEQSYAGEMRDDTKQLRIYIPDRNEELICHYITNHIHELRKPKLLFAVCTDKCGNRFIIADKGAYGKNIEIFDFSKDSLVISAPGPNGADMDVEIEMISNLH